MRLRALSVGVGEYAAAVVAVQEEDYIGILLQEYSDASNAGLPLFIRQRMALDYVDKQYSGDALMKKKAQLLTMLDVTSFVQGNDLPITDVLHARDLLLRIDEMIAEKGAKWFVEADISALRAALVV